MMRTTASGRHSFRLSRVALGVIASLLVVCLAVSTADARRKRGPRRVVLPPPVGKLDARLAAHIAGLQPGDTVPVIIWATPSEVPPELELDARDRSHRAQRAKRRARTAYLVAAHRAKIAPLARALRDQRRRVRLEGRLSPIVGAEVRVRDLAAIAARPEVDMIYLSENDGGEELSTVAQAEFAHEVWVRGITGAGAVAAVVEAGAVAPDNPFLNVAGYFNPGSLDVRAHTTAVAGVIQSTDTVFRGIAPGAAPLLSANAGTFNDIDVIRATEWAILDASPPADVLNYSFFTSGSSGRLFTALDRYADHVVRFHRKLIVKSAGNQGGTSGNVTSPGKGWNVLTVGGWDAFQTPSTEDDILSFDTSWRDPIAPNGLPIAKPEVVAVGCHDSLLTVRMTSTLRQVPWIGAEIGCGTSFAAASVTGQALLIINRRAKLGEWPEALKAIIMASAVRNFEESRTFSSVDGAGGVRMIAADNVARTHSKVFFRTFNGQTFTAQDVMTYSLAGGARSRVVLVWNSNPSKPTGTDAPSTDALQTDLDLEVIRVANAKVIAASRSQNNAFEIVDFVAPAAGTYKVRVTSVASTEHRINYMAVARWP
jgi:hypothetical protein